MKGFANRLLILVFPLLGMFPGGVSAQDEDPYSFNVENFTKKTWEWNGELLTTATSKQFNQESVLYPFKFPDEDRDQFSELEVRLSFESRWDWDWSRLFASVEASVTRTDLDDSTTETSLLREGYWQYSGLDPHNLEIGKRLLRWGKGYAFNPVAFLERPKNPEDPEASREGLWIVQGLWFPGTVSVFDNSSVNLVYLPVRSDINDDYSTSSTERDEWGLKLYALVGTADYDLYLVQRGENDKMDWGFDFAANLSSSLEIHGEYASRDMDESEVNTVLIGTRYLTETEVTWILETYHNSSGLTKAESEALYIAAESGSTPAAKTLMSYTQSGKTLNRNYGYLKISIKEPFDWLYVTPSISSLLNLDDSSFSTNLQLSYAPGNNWRYEILWQHLTGDSNTQYGENTVRDKIVAEVAYSF